MAARIHGETPVLIAGAGPAGLTASLLLARLGIRSMLVERRDGASPLPRATGVDVRTMEVLRSLGLETSVLARAPDMRGMDYIVETNVLGGPILERTPYPNAIDPTAPDAPSPSGFCFISQDAFEPVILDALRRQPQARISFGTDLAGFEQDDRGVTAVLRTRDGAGERRIRARYLVAADGAQSPVRAALGVAMRGHDHLSHDLNILFEADLRRAAHGRRTLLHIVHRPDPPGRGVLRDLDATGRRWSLFTTWFAGASPERCADVVRQYAGDPDLRVDVKAVGEWERATLLADAFRDGRVFLAGDAAHRMTPTGGMGMNTAVQSAHNLAWKLAAVISGWAGPGLLDTYEMERRPVAARKVQLSHELFGQHPRRAGRLLGLILGSAYTEGALVADGSRPPAPEDPVADYIPCARPGHRAPHRWLTIGDRRVSTLDLFAGRFTLLSPSEVSCAAARQRAALLGIPLDAHVITEAAWADLYGVGNRGAVLVRPDGYVGWRTRDLASPEALHRVLDAVLARGEAVGDSAPASAAGAEV